MNTRFLSVVLFSLLLAGSLQARELHYAVDLGQTQMHQVHVTLTLVGFKSKKAVFQMPVSAPGAYSVTHYGRYVREFHAFDKDGTELPVTQENEDRWDIAKGQTLAKIEYDVLDSHSDTTSLYFAMANMDTSLFFANATALFGYVNDDKKAPAYVHYDKPAAWTLACALPPSKSGYGQDTNATFQNTDFYAKDYDALADAPIMAAPGEGPPYMVTRSFRDGKAVYDLAIASDVMLAPAKMDSLTLYLRKIVHAETDFFHDTPFDHYTFVVYAPSLRRTPSYAQGALEHMNSSDYMLSNFAWPMLKRSFISIYSHEFFHLWNVKRIHSALLGPFDYTKRVKTTSLWLAEGVTEYYAHTLLTRYGILPASSFYETIGQWVAAMPQVRDSASHKSLEQLSIDESDFHLDEAEIFYIKGPLVALMLDLEIRNKTNNKRSLDDVMFALNNEAKHGKTFKDQDLIHKVERISGVDLTDFYNRYIHGTDTLPMSHYLSMIGATPHRESEEAEVVPPEIASGKAKREGPMLIDLEAPPAAQAMRKGIVGE
ncbi:MAG: hypothetical protein Q8902_07970 [Bacteroidota bacterium]|nr:hypothetical protein [Bacteroidota bacterium]MDP4232926.1 hypothetical protein [Bacteroidota bacterium]MDP4241970.1 hypothetical protein [Bacteroidota bacterium]